MTSAHSARLEPSSPGAHATSGDLPLLTASEVAEFTFCPEAWYLRRHHVAPGPDHERRLERGAAAHRALGRTTDRIRLVTTVRWLLLIAMAVGAVLLVAQLAGLVNR